MATKTKEKATESATLICNRKELLGAAEIAARAVAKRTPLPILMCLNINATNGIVQVIGDDIERRIAATTIAQHPFENFDICVPCERLLLLLQRFDGDIVELRSETSEHGSHFVHVRGNRSSYKLLGFSPEEFPRERQKEETLLCTVQAYDFLRAIVCTGFAALKDNVRPALAGVFITPHEGNLRAVATDTHRVAVYDCPVLAIASNKHNAILPTSIVPDLLRLIPSEETEVAIWISEDHARFAVGDITITTAVVHEQYPNYGNIVPKNYACEDLQVSREKLLAALGRLSVIASECLRYVRVDVTGREVKLSSQSANAGNAEEFMENSGAPMAGEFSWAFDLKYMQDFCDAADGDTLLMNLNPYGVNQGVSFLRTSEQSNYLYYLAARSVT